MAEAHRPHLVELHRAGGRTSADLAELFGVARATVHRTVAAEPAR